MNKSTGRLSSWSKRSDWLQEQRSEVQHLRQDIVWKHVWFSRKTFSRSIPVSASAPASLAGHETFIRNPFIVFLNFHIKISTDSDPERDEADPGRFFKLDNSINCRWTLTRIPAKMSIRISINPSHLESNQFAAGHRSASAGHLVPGTVLRGGFTPADANADFDADVCWWFGPHDSVPRFSAKIMSSFGFFIVCPRTACYLRLSWSDRAADAEPKDTNKKSTHLWERDEEGQGTKPVVFSMACFWVRILCIPKFFPLEKSKKLPKKKGKRNIIQKERNFKIELWKEMWVYIKHVSYNFGFPKFYLDSMSLY